MAGDLVQNAPRPPSSPQPLPAALTPSPHILSHNRNTYGCKTLN